MTTRISVPVVPVGDNGTRFWGMTVAERTRRIARKHGLPCTASANGAGPAILVNSAFVFDPTWLAHYAALPGQMLTFGAVPIIAHCRDETQRHAAEAAMLAGAPVGGDAGLIATAYENGSAMINQELRKRARPFALPLGPATFRQAERASYFGAYKGVTDLLTKYLWPEWALVLTRIAARLGISPNMVTLLGAILCVVATILFWRGEYWSGMAAALAFMVLDTVDGKLARCTITSSKWGNVFDHGIDLIHPPFWWYAWGVGLAAFGQPLAPEAFADVMTVIIGGYVVQRLIEGAFMRLFGMHIHVWRKLDSSFRLITARRNPNMVILFAATVVGRPDIGLIAVAWWTALSSLFHFVRLAQALAIRARRRDVLSWLG